MVPQSGEVAGTASHETARTISAQRYGRWKEAFVTQGGPEWQRATKRILPNNPEVELLVWSGVAVCYNSGVFGLSKPKLPITAEQQQWTDKSFVRLGGLLGVHRLLEGPVVLPTVEHFPDPYDRSESALRSMFYRVATQMQVNPADVDVTLFASGNDLTRELVPFYSGKSSGAAGLYHHDPTDRPQISINEAQMKDPIALVAVLAHELGHIILLRPGLVDRQEPDMEPLNDLLTVFLGFGIFTANAAFRFEQHSDNTTQGWSAQRLGYLSEEQFGYALARFAFERGERKPAWKSFLSTNVAAYMKRSVAWLTSRNEPRLFPEE
jgi:hypothetical protein